MSGTTVGRGSLNGLGHDEARWRTWSAPVTGRRRHYRTSATCSWSPPTPTTRFWPSLDLLTRHDVTVELLAVTDGEAIVPPPVRARFERPWETVLT